MEENAGTRVDVGEKHLVQEAHFLAQEVRPVASEQLPEKLVSFVYFEARRDAEHHILHEKEKYRFSDKESEDKRGKRRRRERHMEEKERLLYRAGHRVKRRRNGHAENREQRNDGVHADAL